MKPKHILLIDDEASFTRVLKVNLEAHTQHSVTAVNRPHEALPAAHKLKPDLILLDVIMPGVDGGELASRFQSDPELRDVPIVFLTATVSRSEAEKGLKSGGHSFLAKPVKLQDLLNCIARHLGPTVSNVAKSGVSPTPAASAKPVIPGDVHINPASGGGANLTSPTP